ncbi:hypothetical protein [Enterococcus gallinarum]|uniref:hypothetical protein n=1 Tax=Enterococcus gallinarum TaxID=1353 RepID=UPI00321A7DEB
MLKKIPFSKLFRWFAKGYSLVFLSCYVFSRFILFRFSSFRLSTVSDQLTTRTYSSNLIGLLFEPTILLLIIGGLLYLAWKEKHWIKELMYPVVVLLLIVIGTILY